MCDDECEWTVNSAGCLNDYPIRLEWIFECDGDGGVGRTQDVRIHNGDAITRKFERFFFCVRIGLMSWIGNGNYVNLHTYLFIHSFTNLSRCQRHRQLTDGVWNTIIFVKNNNIWHNGIVMRRNSCGKSINSILMTVYCCAAKTSVHDGLIRIWNMI